MTIIETIVLGAVSSIIASFVFWLLTFKWSTTDIIFSDKLEKSPSQFYIGKYRYRFRFANYGHRDLIEISIKARIAVKGIQTKKTNHTLLKVGNDGFVPIMIGRKRNKLTSQVFSLTMGEETLKEYQKNVYTASVREKAKKGELLLEDLFTVYGNRVSITLYLFGNDAVTGARRLFCSREYSVKDIKLGKYRTVIVGTHSSRDSAIKQISKINSIVEAKTHAD